MMRPADVIELGTESDLTVTILGCGSSSGVPRIGNDWGACDPHEPRNRRLRSSILVERGTDDRKTSLLVDTSPDLREQFLRSGTKRLDGVIYTHAHADQAHGIDDLRTVALLMGKRLDVYMDAPTTADLVPRFDYCFAARPGTGYPAILNQTLIEPSGGPIVVDGPGGPIEALPFAVGHGPIGSLGFRFGPLAYTPDVNEIPDEAFARLQGIECWIVDALRYRPHPSHAHLALSLSWLERAKARLGILTNLHLDMDYATLVRDLPAGVIPAHDGLIVKA